MCLLFQHNSHQNSLLCLKLCWHNLPGPNHSSDLETKTWPMCTATKGHKTLMQALEGEMSTYRRVLRSMSRQIHGEQAHKLSACVSSSGSSETLLSLDVALPLLNELHSWLNRLVKLQTLCNSQIALQTMLLLILTKTICSSYAMSHTTWTVLSSNCFQTRLFLLAYRPSISSRTQALSSMLTFLFRLL